MRNHLRRFAFVPALALLALAPGPASGQNPAGAAEGFRAIQEACRKGDPAALEKVLPPGVGEGTVGKDAAALAAWRKGMAAAIAGGTLAEVREAKQGSVVRLKSGTGEESEILLGSRMDGWFVSSPVAYLVKGKALDAANGRGPATVTLKARTVNGPYGTAAVSFAHATQDPKQCLNRMDLWYCWNGDLHGSGEDRIARVAAKDLAAVTGIPAGAAWKDCLAPEAAGVYVVHCRRREHRDFFVKVRVKAADEKKADLEWALLAAGFGSPSDIHAPRPIVSNDGTDGWDGLCERNPERSKPEPVPAPAGTPTPR